MHRCMQSTRRLLTVVAATALAAMASGSSAMAGTDTWYSNLGLLGLTADASTAAHSVAFVRGDTNHNNFCVSKQTGYAGHESVYNLTSSPQACSSSGGIAYRNENGSCCYHGWIGNYNNFDIYVYSAYYTY